MNMSDLLALANSSVNDDVSDNAIVVSASGVE